jgi:hypothetical protein
MKEGNVFEPTNYLVKKVHIKYEFVEMYTFLFFLLATDFSLSPFAFTFILFEFKLYPSERRDVFGFD